MLKEQDIREYLNKKDIAFNENSSIIGVIFPSKFTYALGPIATALFVPKEEIASTKFNKKLMSYELEVATSKGTLAFKVNKTMVGASWHKENLATILNRF